MKIRHFHERKKKILKSKSMQNISPSKIILITWIWGLFYLVRRANKYVLQKIFWAPSLRSHLLCASKACQQRQKSPKQKIVEGEGRAHRKQDLSESNRRRTQKFFIVFFFCSRRTAVCHFYCDRPEISYMQFCRVRVCAPTMRHFRECECIFMIVVLRCGWTF